MDRQRNLSFKPTRLLVLSFTIASSIIFTILFTIWVIKVTPSVPQEIHFQFNTSSLALGLKTVTVQTLTGLSENSSSPSKLKDKILIDTQLSEDENTSGVSENSAISDLKREKSEPEVVEEEEDGLVGNFTSMGDEEIEVPSSENLSNIQLKKHENISGLSENSVFNGQQREKTEPKAVEDEDGLIGNFTLMGDEEIEAPSSEIWNNTQLRKYENISGVSEISVISGQQREKADDEGLTGNLTTSVGYEEIEESKNSAETMKKKGLVLRIEKVEDKRTRKCDVTKGKWVYDERYPLYTNGSCPFIDEGFDCFGNGRLDKGYMKLRWQPQDCDIPRFNATRMLEQLRGKRLVFVGDSINRNQWESMLCMLMGGIEDRKKVYETHGRRITKEKGNYSFRFVDYKCTVEYYVTHFLVHEGKARVGKKRVETLQIDTIDRGSSRWKGADILVFNTAHWWSHYKTKSGVNYYQEAGQVHPRLDFTTAFRKALMTWASWVDKHINPSKTRVFFRSSAPSHFRGGQWNSGGRCREATLPLQEISGNAVSEKNIIVEEVVKEMRTPVTVLNISTLSDYRIDGHPSSYGKRPGNQYSLRIQDCSHWCLPGVPDSWNEILYAYLQSKPGLADFTFLDQ